MAVNEDVPSGLNSTGWSWSNGRVTIDLDDDSCNRPLLSNNRTFPSLIRVTSVHGSCFPELDESDKTIRLCNP